MSDVPASYTSASNPGPVVVMPLVQPPLPSKLNPNVAPFSTPSGKPIAAVHFPTSAPLTCKGTPVPAAMERRVVSASDPGVKVQAFLQSITESIAPKFNLHVVKTAQKVNDVAFRYLSDGRYRQPLVIQTRAQGNVFFLYAKETKDGRNQIYDAERWIHAVENAFARDAISMCSLCTDLRAHSVLVSTEDRARSHREIGMMLFYLNAVAYTGTHISQIESIAAGSQFYYPNPGTSQTLAHHSVLAELSDDYPQQLEGRLLSFFNTYLSSSKEPTEEFITEGKELFMELIAHGMSYQDVESLFYAILSKRVIPERILEILKEQDLKELFSTPLKRIGPNPSTGLGYTSPMYLLSQLGELEAAEVNYVDSLLETHRVKTTVTPRPVSSRELAKELLKDVAQGRKTPLKAQEIFTSFAKEALLHQGAKIQQLIELQDKLDSSYDDLEILLAKELDKRPTEKEKAAHLKAVLEKLIECKDTLDAFETTYQKIYLEFKPDVPTLPQPLDYKEERAALKAKIDSLKTRLDQYNNTSLSTAQRFKPLSKAWESWKESIDTVLTNAETNNIPQALLDLQPIIQAEIEGIEAYEAKVASKQFAAEDLETTRTLGQALRARSVSTDRLSIVRS